MAAKMTTDPNPRTALRAHCIQALIAVMRRYGRWQCPASDASALLQRQLCASHPADVERYYTGDRLQLAVAADLLSNALPLLRKLNALEPEPGTDASLEMVKIELKEVLDAMCCGLDASDLPDDLRARFADGAEVVRVFGTAAALDVNGPWTKIFRPVESGRGEQSEGHRMSGHPPALPPRLSREICT
jgi:hypothetical protein